MWTPLAVGLAALVWITALDKARTVGWWPREPVQRANLVALTALALILSLGVSPVYEGVGWLAGVANIALLLANGLTVFGLWAFQPLVVHARQLARDYSREHGVTGLLAEPTRARRVFASGGIMIAVVLLLCALFALAPVRGAEYPDYDEFLAQYATVPFMPAYTTIFAAYAGGMVSELFLLAALTGRKLPTRALRLRAYFQAAGWAMYIASLVHTVLFTIARLSGFVYPTGEARLVRYGLIVVGGVLLMSGGLIDLCAWVGRWIKYCRLYPLWRALWRAIPAAMQDDEFPPARLAIYDALAVNNLDSRLYRRMITIRDGIVALSAYADACVSIRARHLCRRVAVSDEMTAAIIEAATIRSALRARVRGDTTHPDRHEPGVTILRSDAGSVMQLTASELAHLLRVARVFRRSQLVDAALADPMSRGTLADETTG